MSEWCTGMVHWAAIAMFCMAAIGFVFCFCAAISCLLLLAATGGHDHHVNVVAIIATHISASMLTHCFFSVVEVGGSLIRSSHVGNVIDTYPSGSFFGVRLHIVYSGMFFCC